MTIAPSPHRLMTPDGVTVSLDLYCPRDRNEVVIICPGFFQSTETRIFRRISLAMAHGRDVIAMDFRGHGRSGGLYTFSAREGADLETVIEWTAARYRRIGILGFSMGAAIAINTVSRHQDRVRSLVAVSAPSAFEEIEFKWWTLRAIRGGIEGLEWGAGFRPGNPFLKKERPMENIQRLREIPVLFIHGTRDAIVDVRHSRRLYEAAAEPKRLEIVEGGSHSESLFRHNPHGFSRLVNGWFAQTL